jgi:hypothetical protein
MLRSSFKSRDLLKGLLSDPKAIKDAIVKLEAQEKKTKAALKKMLDAKSIKAFTEDCEARAEQANINHTMLLEQADIIIANAKAEAEEIKTKAKLVLQSAETKLSQAAEEVAKAKTAKHEFDRSSKIIRQSVDKAQTDEAKYKALRNKYEKALSELKSRFEGLV